MKENEPRLVDKTAEKLRADGKWWNSNTFFKRKIVIMLTHLEPSNQVASLRILESLQGLDD